MFCGTLSHATIFSISIRSSRQAGGRLSSGKSAMGKSAMQVPSFNTVPAPHFTPGSFEHAPTSASTATASREHRPLKRRCLAFESKEKCEVNLDTDSILGDLNEEVKSAS
jgi:hypothetical protein